MGVGGFKSLGLLGVPPVMGHARISAKFENFFLPSGGRGVGWRRRKRDENGVEQENEQR